MGFFRRLVARVRWVITPRRAGRSLREGWEEVEFEEESWEDYVGRRRRNETGLQEHLVRETPKGRPVAPEILVDLWLEDQAVFRTRNAPRAQDEEEAVEDGVPGGVHTGKLDWDARISARLNGSARRVISFAPGTRLTRALTKKNKYENKVPRVALDDDEKWRMFRE
jgi:hypothetical protein